MAVGADAASSVGTAAIPVALNWRSGSPLTSAVAVLAPGVVPRIHCGPRATPSAPVKAVVAPSNRPPPPVTAKVTTAPATGSFCGPSACTAGARSSSVPALASWLLPSAT